MAGQPSTFELFSKSGDGFITDEEVALIARTMGYMISQRDGEQLGQTCADPKRISQQEFNQLTAQMYKPDANTERQLLEAFRVFDRDDTGPFMSVCFVFLLLLSKVLLVRMRFELSSPLWVSH